MKSMCAFLLLAPLASVTSYAATTTDRLTGLIKKSVGLKNLKPLCDFVHENKDIRKEFKVIQVQKDSPFCSGSFSSKGLRFEKTIGSSSLPVYPKVSGEFVIASFEDGSSPSLRSLPKEMKSYISESMAKAKAAAYSDKYPEQIKLTPAEIQKLFPEWSKQSFYAVSKTKTVAVTPTLVKLDAFTDSGQLQLRADFLAAPADTLFIKVGTSQVSVKPLTGGAKLSPLEANSNVLAVELSKGLVFFSTLESSSQEFTLVWDKSQERIVFFSTADGNSWGNENNDFKESFLVVLDGRTFILRKTDRSVQAIYVDQAEFRQEVIADLRAPEV